MRLVTAASLVALVACVDQRPPVKADLEKPYVLSVSPAGTVPTDATFRVQFSEPVKQTSLFWADADAGAPLPDGVVIAPVAYQAVDETGAPKGALDPDNVSNIVSELNSPPISATSRPRIVVATVELSADRTEVIITPQAPLKGDTDYVVVVSKKVTDDANNPLMNSESQTNETQVFEFRTEAPPDTGAPTAKLLSPAPGATGIALDTREVVVEFSEPMDNSTFERSSVMLMDGETQQEIRPTSTRWAENRLTLVLPDGFGTDCDVLCPGVSYRLYVDPAVTDLAGNPLAPVDAAQQFTAAVCVDDAPPTLGTPDVRESDVSAQVTFKSDEPVTGTVNFESCSGPCPPSVPLPAATCAPDICALPTDEVDFACSYAVRLTGLNPTQTYNVRIRVFDSGGRAAVSEPLTFQTLAPLPKLVLNELFAGPKTSTSGPITDANQAKFLEIQNVGNIAVDLTPTGSGSTRKAWSLARCPTPDCAGSLTNVWPMKPVAGPSTLAPGAYAVAAGNAFDATLMGVPASATLLKNDGSSTTVLSNGLTSTTAYAYALLSPDGAIISTYGAHLGKPNLSATTGRSFERKVATDDDVATNWSVCQSPVSGATGNYATPGSRNSNSP